jgi:hypothetical protein
MSLDNLTPNTSRGPGSARLVMAPVTLYVKLHRAVSESEAGRLRIQAIEDGFLSVVGDADFDNQQHTPTVPRKLLSRPTFQECWPSRLGGRGTAGIGRKQGVAQIGDARVGAGANFPLFGIPRCRFTGAAPCTSALLSRPLNT